MRVVIADDHRLVLDGIKRALEADGGFEIVGETQSGTQVLPLVGKTSPDLVQAGQPVHLRHPDVEDDQVRPRPLDDREDVGAVEGLADDLEAAVGFERVVDSGQHEPVVVCNDYAHGLECCRERCQTAEWNQGRRVKRT